MSSSATLLASIFMSVSSVASAPTTCTSVVYWPLVLGSQSVLPPGPLRGLLPSLSLCSTTCWVLSYVSLQILIGISANLSPCRALSLVAGSAVSFQPLRLSHLKPILIPNRRPPLHLLVRHEQGPMVLIPQEDRHVQHQPHHSGNCLCHRKFQSYPNHF